MNDGDAKNPKSVEVVFLYIQFGELWEAAPMHYSDLPTYLSCFSFLKIYSFQKTKAIVLTYPLM